jgi:transcriptional regulator
MVLYVTKDLTTIQLSKTVREQLKKLGKKGETYDAIIRRLIKAAENNTEGEN